MPIMQDDDILAASGEGRDLLAEIQAQLEEALAHRGPKHVVDGWIDHYLNGKPKPNQGQMSSIRYAVRTTLRNLLRTYPDSETSLTDMRARVQV